MEPAERSAEEIVRRVERHIRRFAMLSPGERVVVGCSGGADSTCLLHILTQGLPELGLECVAVYVDHGLRPEAGREARWVEERARSLGAEFACERVDVPARAQRAGESVQEAARALRYEALARVKERFGASRIAVGHTRSDQAETVLLQLLRGAGPRGLSGIPPVRGEIVRPLLCVGRRETENYCRAVGIDWLEDPSNRSPKYLRSRVRFELMPLMESLRPGVEARLAATAEILRDEDRYLEEQVAKALEGLVRPAPEEGGLAVEGEALARMPVAIARRAVRAIAARVREEARGLSLGDVEAVLALAQEKGGSGKRLELGPVWVVREYSDLHFLAAPPAKERRAAEAPVELAVPGRTVLPWAEAVVDASLHPAEQEAPLDAAEHASSPGAGGAPPLGAAAVMDWEKLRPPLVARGRRPGDRLQPAGMKGRKKVKDLLIDAKVPRRLRERVAIVEDREGIVWVVGHALAERVRPGPESRRLLRLEVRPMRGADL